MSRQGGLKEQSSGGRKMNVGGKNEPWFVTRVEGSGFTGSLFCSNVISPEKTTLSENIPHDAGCGICNLSGPYTVTNRGLVMPNCVGGSIGRSLFIVVGLLGQFSACWGWRW